MLSPLASWLLILGLTAVYGAVLWIAFSIADYQVDKMKGTTDSWITRLQVRRNRREFFRSIRKLADHDRRRAQ